MAQKPIKKDRSELVFVAMGGLGEIGMNCYLYGLGPPSARQWLMVDLGLTFPGDGEFGVDVVFPDLRFISAERGNLAGIVITHAHEDHIGAVIDNWHELRAPIYASPFTLGMLKAKLGDYGGDDPLPLNKVELGSRFDVGPFDIELVDMAHSIPEPSALAIRTRHGLVVHSGDWKLDDTPVLGRPCDVKKLKALGEEGVEALICDSTNALRDGVSPSESDVAASLADIIKKHDKRVVVTTFSSNVGRVKAVADAAAAAGRKLVVAGRAIHRVIQVGIETGYLPEDFTYLDQDQFSYLDRHEIVLLCTGSQGEGRAALSRIADGDHQFIKLAKGDLVIYSSRDIPGNEKSIGRVQNNLARLGVDIMTDSEALVHVTGHPRRDELKQMYSWLKPRVAIPMHGEARHLKEHAALAKTFGTERSFVVVDGEVMRLAPSPAGVIDEAPVGRKYRDGKLIVSSTDGPVRDRRKLAASGIAVVALALSKRGDLLDEPEVVLDGIPEDTADGDDMYDVVLDAIDGTISSIPPARRKDPDLVREAVRKAVRSAISNEWGKRPITKVLVSQVNVKANA
ncbi:MAG: ribonuclease J [Pseudomonadota bacterium]